MDYINASIRQFAMAIGDLVPDPDNSRKHNDRNIETILNSMKQFGQTIPILIEKGTNIIICGHGRLAAALQLGWTHLAAISIEKNSEAERKLLNIVDNRSSELAEWDMSKLALSLQEVANAGYMPGSFGFNTQEMDQLTKLMLPDNQSESQGDNAISEMPPVQSFPNAISLTWEQRAVFEKAFSITQQQSGNISEGRFVELLAADYLSGMPVESSFDPDDSDGNNG